MLLSVAALMVGAAAMEQVLSVDKFHGVAASGGIEVHAEVSASSGSSVMLQGESDAVSGITSSVDFWGTLLLGRTEGAAAGRVVAKVTVPRPLTFAGAMMGSSIFADNVSGFVVVASHSQIRIKQLNSSNSTSIVASDRSYVNVSEGHVPYISVSASDRASIDLGFLSATISSISVSSNSTVFNGTVNYGSISVSSNSMLRMNATDGVGVSCSQSIVHLGGGGKVTKWSNSGCSMDLSRRLDAADVLV